MYRFLIKIDSPDDDLLSSGEFIIRYDNSLFIVANHLIEIINDLDLYIIKDKDICIKISGYDMIEDYYIGKVIKVKFNDTKKLENKNNDG